MKRRSEISPLTRRRFLGLAAATSSLALPWLARAGAIPAATSSGPNVKLPGNVPPGVGAILAHTFARGPEALNTDWFGTTLLDGVLAWSRRGVCDARAFATAWLEFHARHENVSRFQGPKSRVFRAGGVPISTYAGHYGFAMPCYAMAMQFQDERARAACVDVANIILHHARRDGEGLVAHDDGADFAIPDTCYFVVTPLMLAAELEPKRRDVFREQALVQLQLYTDRFLVPETGLAKTIRLPDGLGKTYWTRASGWLLWAMTSVLRYLPESDPRRPALLRQLATLAQGLARVQEKGGGLRVLLDDPTTPLETTGTAMDATGLHEAVRRGWLPAVPTNAFIGPAWEFVRGNLTPDGNIVHAFTGWAMPAEKRQMVIDHQKQEWVPGFLLRVTDEMTT